MAGASPAVEQIVKKTTTQTITKTEVNVAIAHANLTSEEEKVLRMRYGIALEPDAALATHATTAQGLAQLEAIEKKALLHARRQHAVIERLRRIDR